MNLDDIQYIQSTDRNNLLAHIDSLPDRLRSAWEESQTAPVPVLPQQFRQVALAGLGDAAVGAELAQAWAASFCPIPITLHRSYSLPAWVSGPQTLVITCGESFSQAQAAVERGCCHKAIQSAEAPVVFAQVVAALSRLGQFPNPDAEMRACVAAMQTTQASLRAETPVSRNPAKRMAGQLVGRTVTFFASEALAPVTRHWKNQVNLQAKALAQFELLPEANHNTIQGLVFPPDVLAHNLVLFLNAPSDHSANRQHSDSIRQAYLLEGLNTDFIKARGKTHLEHLWTLYHFGEYLAFYLAIAYGIDPSARPTHL